MHGCGPVFERLAILALGVNCSAPALCAAAETSGVSAVKIPFVVGLSTVRAVSAPEGDYEALGVVASIDASGYRVNASAEVPDPDEDGKLREVKVTRKVLAADRVGARKMRSYFHEDDADSFSGTVPGFSAAVVNDLRNSGKAALIYLDVGDFFGTSAIKAEYRGTLTRMAGPPTTLPVLVNGRITALPVIHARGTLTGNKGPAQFEFFVLDDPANPILLRSSVPGQSTAILRIEFPQPKESPASIESALAKNEVAEIYGIYFSFNRADIRPESERVLEEIAGVLTAHPQWKLRVDGHTDGIGNDAANLDLSRRRSAAVKTALVTRHGIDGGRLVTGGFGESQPQAGNDTPEGRARNRRVELRRL
jgi:outer membrane protein OmpA-like peptidoglycan-associated protein